MFAEAKTATAGERLTKPELISLHKIYADYHGCKITIGNSDYFIQIRNKNKPMKPRLYMRDSAGNMSGLFVLADGRLKGSLNGCKFLLFFNDTGRLQYTEAGASMKYEVRYDL